MMLDMDGQFLSHLLTESQEIDAPFILSYDVNTHNLWVGSYNKKICVYKYLDQLRTLIGKFISFLLILKRCKTIIRRPYVHDQSVL